MTNITFLSLSLIAYLLGSLSSAIIVCKLLNKDDPRFHGSHNPGATNVLRIAGKWAAAFTLIGDVVKGMIPVIIGKWLGLSLTQLTLIGSCAILGHLFPIFYQFKGGKGIATFLGVLTVLFFPLAFYWVVAWLIILIFTRYASLASMVASFLTPFFVAFYTHDILITLNFIVIVALLILRHRLNIKKKYRRRRI